MRFTLPGKRKKQPTLVTGQKAPVKQKLETFKAGKLASLALEFTNSIIDKFGPRLAGSESSAKAAEAIEQAYAEFCDTTSQTSCSIDTTLHSFTLNVAVYVYPIIIVLMLFGLPWLSLALFGVYIWYVTRQLYLYRPLKFPKRPVSEGINVHGILEPEQEVLHTIIFSGHHDSAPLHHFNSLDRFSYAKTVLFPIVLFALSGVLSLVQVLAELFSLVLFLPNLPSIPMLILLGLLLFATPFLFPLRHFYEKEGSPGAGDNLASVGMTVELARYFHWKRECEKPLKHTRIIFCSFDGEESALQGSREWFKTQKELLIDPVVLNFDCVYFADHLSFLERDINGTQRLSESLARRCVEISRSMGYEANSVSIPRLGGGTDAAEASRMDIPATTLSAVSWDDRSKPSVYHTKADVVEAIEPKALETAISVAIKLTGLVDSGYLWSKEEPDLDEPEKEISLTFSKLTSR